MSKNFMVGRQANYFFIKTILYGKSMKILLKQSEIRLQYPESLQKSLSRPQNIRACRVTGIKTFSLFGLIWISHMVIMDAT